MTKKRTRQHQARRGVVDQEQTAKDQRTRTRGPLRTTWASAWAAGGRAGARVKDAKAPMDLGRARVDQRELCGRDRWMWWDTFLDAAFDRASVKGDEYWTYRPRKADAYRPLRDQ
jgi:hypothetical protein